MSRSAHEPGAGTDGPGVADPGLAAFAGQAPGHAPPLERLASEERRGIVRVGVWVAVGCMLSGLLYAAQTWEEPHRLALVLVSVGGVVFGSLPGLFFFERLRPVPQRAVWGRFHLVWTVTASAAIAAVTLIDGGAGSPLLAGFLIIQLYAALFYPTRAAVLAAGWNGTIGLAIVLASPVGERASAIAILAGLPIAAGMAVYHARMQRRHRAELARLARIDPLTGALNRRGFAERLASAVDEARAGEQAMHLAVVDLDGFKAVNDAHGHAAGDELLAWVSARLSDVPWPVHAVGRLGGDEFAVLLDPRDSAPADVTATIRERLGDRIAASIGGARLPEDGDRVADLLALADGRAYDEKRGHRAAAG